jgi:ketosteroid isomerase-like protein
MSQENVEVVLQLYEGLNSGVSANEASDEVLSATFDPAIETVQLGALAGTRGTFVGYDGLREAARELDEAWREYRFELLEHAAKDDLVAFDVKAHASGRASGISLEIRLGHLFDLRGGRIARWVVYDEPRDALEAVGLSE